MFQALAVIVLGALAVAEPPVDKVYLPPSTALGPHAPSSSYGTPTTADFGAGGSGQFDLSRSGFNSGFRPSSQYGVPGRTSRPSDRQRGGFTGALSSQYGAPSGSEQISSQYGAPTGLGSQGQISSHYGTPGAGGEPSSQYGPPSAASFQGQIPSQYGAPSASGPLSSQYGAPTSGEQISSQYGTPSSLGPHAQISSQYGAPGGHASSRGQPSGQYGAPFGSGAPASQRAHFGASSSSLSSRGQFQQGSFGAPSSQYGAPSSQYGAPQVGGSDYTGGDGSYAGARRGGYGGYQMDDDKSEPANYDFSYDVNSPENYVEYGHEENRQGDQAQGKFHVLLPDGRKQVVEYTADEEGFKPNIRYEETGSAAGYGRQGGASGYDGGYAAGASSAGYQRPSGIDRAHTSYSTQTGVSGPY